MTGSGLLNWSGSKRYIKDSACLYGELKEATNCGIRGTPPTYGPLACLKARYPFVFPPGNPLSSLELLFPNYWEQYFFSLHPCLNQDGIDVNRHPWRCPGLSMTPQPLVCNSEALDVATSCRRHILPEQVDEQGTTALPQTQPHDLPPRGS
jgi:hypothetical protein